MYTGRNLGDASSILSTILQTGEQIVRDVTRPVFTNPTLNLPGTPPFIDPRTGQLVQAKLFPDYTTPLLIGGGLLLLLLATRRRRRRK